MIFDFFALLIGRLIVGYSVGVLSVLTPLFISEVSPVELSGPLGTLSQIMCTVGIMIGYFMGYLAPLKLTPAGKDNPAILSTNSWRYVFMVPGVIAITHSLLLLFVFKHDTPKYYRQVGNEVMAKKVSCYDKTF